MLLITHPTKSLRGHATPPSSKSHSVRALLLATLAAGTSHLFNVLDADDTKAAIEICKSFGANMQIIKNSSGGLDITIQSEGAPLNSQAKEFFSSNSGITTTFAIPIIGLRKNPEAQVTLPCGEQMQKRPLSSIIQAVKDLGMDVVSLNKNQSCPLNISGDLKGGYCTVDGSNSQYLSALLLSLPCAKKNSVVVVKNLRELPYVDMTLAWLDEQNIRYAHFKKDSHAATTDTMDERDNGAPEAAFMESAKNIDVFKIFGNQQYKSFNKTIPGDFSSASYLIAAGILLPGEITLLGLDMNDPQGDKRIIPILQRMGADIQIIQTKNVSMLEGLTPSSDNPASILQIKGGKPLQGTTIDCGDIPDMLPTLAVIATQAKGKTVLFNVANARIKETDRIKSMATELQKMGVKVEETESSLVIHESKLHATHVHGYGDHRTIMALAVAGLLANGETKIDTAEGISKTFPNFVKTMKTIGANMKYQR